MVIFTHLYRHFRTILKSIALDPPSWAFSFCPQESDDMSSFIHTPSHVFILRQACDFSGRSNLTSSYSDRRFCHRDVCNVCGEQEVSASVSGRSGGDALDCVLTSSSLSARANMSHDQNHASEGAESQQPEQRRRLQREMKSSQRRRPSRRSVMKFILLISALGSNKMNWRSLTWLAPGLSSLCTDRRNERQRATAGTKIKDIWGHAGGEPAPLAFVCWVTSYKHGGKVTLVSLLLD